MTIETRTLDSIRSDRCWPHCSLLSACASQAPQRGTGAPAASTRTPSGNADELAGDALQALVDGNGQHALAAIARANLRRTERPDLAWLHVRICMLTPGCEPEPVEARLRKLAPDNGVVWLGPLARAQARQDKRVEDQILEAMSQRAAVRSVLDRRWSGDSAPRATRMPPAPGTSGAPPQPLTEALDQTTEALSALSCRRSSR